MHVCKYRGVVWEPCALSPPDRDRGQRRTVSGHPAPRRGDRRPHARVRDQEGLEEEGQTRHQAGAQAAAGVDHGRPGSWSGWVRRESISSVGVGCFDLRSVWVCRAIDRFDACWRGACIGSKPRATVSNAPSPSRMPPLEGGATIGKRVWTTYDWIRTAERHPIAISLDLDGDIHPFIVDPTISSRKVDRTGQRAGLDLPHA